MPSMTFRVLSLNKSFKARFRFEDLSYRIILEAPLTGKLLVMFGRSCHGVMFRFC